VLQQRVDAEGVVRTAVGERVRVGGEDEQLAGDVAERGAAAPLVARPAQEQHVAAPRGDRPAVARQQRRHFFEARLAVVVVARPALGVAPSLAGPACSHRCSLVGHGLEAARQAAEQVPFLGRQGGQLGQRALHEPIAGRWGHDGVTALAARLDRRHTRRLARFSVQPVRLRQLLVAADHGAAVPGVPPAVLRLHQHQPLQ